VVADAFHTQQEVRRRILIELFELQMRLIKCRGALTASSQRGVSDRSELLEGLMALEDALMVAQMAASRI
jgi:hypothetical protein